MDHFPSDCRQAISTLSNRWHRGTYLNNGWREDTLTVNWHRNTNIRKHEQPRLPITDRTLDDPHVERALRRQPGIRLQSLQHHLLLERRQELGLLIRPVLDEPGGGESSDEGEETFNDEDPGPAGFAADTVHLGETVAENAAARRSGKLHGI